MTASPAGCGEKNFSSTLCDSPPAMTECIIILALLSLLVATDPEPGVPFITPRQETFLTIPRLIHR